MNAKWPIGSIVALIGLLFSVLGFAFYLGELHTDIKHLKQSGGVTPESVAKNLAEDANLMGQSVVPTLVSNARFQELVTERASDVRPGTIAAYAGTKAPEGWLLCDGKQHPIDDYEELASVLAGHWNNPADYQDQSVFRVPNLQGVFLRGLGGFDPDEDRKLGGYQGDALEEHTHLVNTARLAEGNYADAFSVAGPREWHWSNGKVLSADAASETRPLNVAVNWIVKS